MVNKITLPDGKFITVHELDTKSTIKDKIAILYNIDPRYIKKINIVDNNVSEIKTIKDVFADYIEKEEKDNKKKKKNEEQVEPNFKNFYEYAVNFGLTLTPTEYVQIWRELWEGFSIPETKQLYETSLKHDINILEKLYPEIKFEKNKLDSRITLSVSSDTKNRIAEFDRYSSEFKNLKGVPTTHFEQTKQYVDIKIENKDNYPLIYLFDTIQLGDKIPFAVYNKYCKIYDNFTLHGEPPISDTSIHLLYKRSVIDESTTATSEEGVQDKSLWYRNYSVITIKIIEDVIVLEMSIENNSNIDSIISNIETVLRWPYVIDKHNITTNKISGEFYIVNQNINPTILKDVLLFYPIFRNIMYANDIIINYTNVNTKERNKYSTTIHYIEPDTNNEFVYTISTREVAKGDLSSNINVGGNIKIGQPLTVCNIRQAATTASITKFQTFVSKLITVYNNHEKSLTEFYSKYLKNVNDRVFKVNEDTLASAAPEIFIDLYSKACPKQRNPIIVHGGDEKYNDKDTSMMKFPKTGENILIYQCDKHDYPFVGLKDNTLENKEDYPFLPCCYKIDQKNNKKSNYYKYFYDSDLNSNDSSTMYKLKTQKFGNYGIYGILPENVHKLFGLLDKQNEYYRKGMHYEGECRKFTFLECVLEALNYNDILKMTVEKERVNLLKKQRYELSEFVKTTAICKQECYNLTLSEISEQLKDNTLYFDPGLYIRAVEEFYNINIILFTRDNQMDKNGNFLLPRHDTSKGYIFPTYKNRPTIIIYEHTGGIYTKDKSCELVIRHNEHNLQTVSMFKPTDDIIQKIYKLWIQTFPVYETNKIVLPINPPDINNISEQYVDVYGKTRGLYYKNTMTFIYCMPIAPLNLPLVKDTKVVNINSFVSRYNLENHNLENYKTKEGFVFYNHNVKDSYSNSSFVYNKRTSVHLIEYALYLYSVFLQTVKKNTYSTSKLVAQFIKQYVKINPNVTYDIDYMMPLRDNKIIEVENIEIKNKLEYMIRVNLLNRRKEIVNYYKLNYLHNFYNTIYDFKTYPKQYIHLVELLYNTTHDSKLYLYPPKDFSSKTYNIRYKNINYFAQPCKHLGYVTNRLYNWNKLKKNIINGYGKNNLNEFICIPFINDEYQIPIQIKDGKDLVIYSNQNGIEYYIILFPIENS